MTAVTFVFTITLWMRLVGATASGWFGDRIGRKTPLMISILGYSLCNFIAGFSPTFWFLLLFRALLGLFMGAEWPAGASLAMETWPIRSRGLMSGVLQGSWGLGFLLSTCVYGLFYKYDRLARHAVGRHRCRPGARLCSLFCQGTRSLDREPPAPARPKARGQGAAAQDLQARHARQHIHHVLVSGGGFVTYYSINALFATHLQKDLGLSPALIATPIAFANISGVSRQLGLGLGVGQDRPPPGDDHPGAVRDPARADLSVFRQFHLGGDRLCHAGAVRRRRHVRPGAELS